MKRILAVALTSLLAVPAFATDPPGKSQPRWFNFNLGIGNEVTSANNDFPLGIFDSAHPYIRVKGVCATIASCIPTITLGQRTTANGSDVVGWDIYPDATGLRFKNAVSGSVLLTVNSSSGSFADLTGLTFGPAGGSATPADATILGWSSVGTDIAAGNIILKPGVSTGAAAGANVLIQTAAAGSTGSTPQTPTTTFSFGATVVKLGATLGSATPTSRAISGEPALGTNIAGADLQLYGGLSTGSATPSRTLIKSSVAGGSSSTAQTAVINASFTNSGITLGDSASIAAPTARTILGEPGTGTNVVGGGVSIGPGAGTGTGGGVKTSLRRNLVTTTGTSAQAQQDGFIICESKTMSNTTATLQTMAQVATSSNTGGSLTIFYGTTAGDGTNFDSDAASMNVAWVNKAGTVTTAVGTLSSIAQASNSGSVASTATAPASGVNVNLSLSPAFTTIVPTTVTSYMTIVNHGPATITCQ